MFGAHKRFMTKTHSSSFRHTLRSYLNGTDFRSVRLWSFIIVLLINNNNNNNDNDVDDYGGLKKKNYNKHLMYRYQIPKILLEFVFYRIEMNTKRVFGQPLQRFIQIDFKWCASISKKKKNVVSQSVFLPITHRLKMHLFSSVKGIEERQFSQFPSFMLYFILIYSLWCIFLETTIRLTYDFL